MKRPEKIRSRTQYVTFIILICFFLLAGMCLSVFIGAVEVRVQDILKIIINHLSGREVFLPDWENSIESIIWNIRLPRVLLACIVGAGLSVCGVLMQALTKNALADPYVLGISSGASAGAVCTIILGWFSFMGGYATIFGAVLGAIASITLSLQIATVKGKITAVQLVLAGIATSAIFTALTNLLIYGLYSGSDKVKTAQYWMVGSLSGAEWSKVKYVAVVFWAVMACILFFTKDLDILLLGDDVAESLGVNTRRLKYVIILMATALTGVVVSVSGVIGFIGLVVPHIMRAVVGSRHIRLIPAVMLAGGLFTMLADLAARVIIDPQELPIGIISALAGGPFFLYLIKKNMAG